MCIHKVKAWQKQALNCVLSTVQLAEMSSIFIPLTTPLHTPYDSKGWQKYMQPNVRENSAFVFHSELKKMTKTAYILLPDSPSLSF